jgi:hypothetical protein
MRARPSTPTATEHLLGGGWCFSLISRKELSLKSNLLWSFQLSIDLVEWDEVWWNVSWVSHIYVLL